MQAKRVSERELRLQVGACRSLASNHLLLSNLFAGQVGAACWGFLSDLPHNPKGLRRAQEASPKAPRARTSKAPGASGNPAPAAGLLFYSRNERRVGI